MDFENSDDWNASFDNFFSHFAHLFKRSESRFCARDYVRGLLADVRRKNCWQVAEAMGLDDPQAMQRLLYEAQWDDRAVRRKLREVMVTELGYQPGVGVIDESGFVKKGEQSVGVQRQWCGRLGKVENCQVAVFLGYVTAFGSAFLDSELYLPQSWCEDVARRQTARVPPEVQFQTKPELALAMLEQVWSEGIPMHWVVGDTVYGNSPALRNAIAKSERYYVMEIPGTNTVYPRGEADAMAVQALARQLSDPAWERMAFQLGEKGLHFYDWAAVRGVAPTDEIGEQWLLIRRSVGEKPECKYSLSNAPADTPLAELAAIALSRHPIEPLLEEAKGEAGLADYEVRHWPSWYRHITLSLVAHTWLALIRHKQREKKPVALLDEFQPA